MPKAKSDPNVGLKLDGKTSGAMDMVAAPMVVVEQVSRKMKFHAVTQSEIESLSMLNDLQLGFVSAAGVFLGIGLPDIYTWAFDRTGQADWRKPVFFLGIGVVLLLVAVWPRRKAQTVWQRIGSETMQEKPGAEVS